MGNRTPAKMPGLMDSPNAGVVVDGAYYRGNGQVLHLLLEVAEGGSAQVPRRTGIMKFSILTGKVSRDGG